MASDCGAEVIGDDPRYEFVDAVKRMVGNACSRRGSVEVAKASLASMSDHLPAVLVDSLQDQLSRLSALDEQIHRIEQRITEWRRDVGAMRRAVVSPRFPVSVR